MNKTIPNLRVIKRIIEGTYNPDGVVLSLESGIQIKHAFISSFKVILNLSLSIKPYSVTIQVN